MEIAKFMFKFNNQMLPYFFNNYSTKLDNVHNYNTEQKTLAEFFLYSVASESRKTRHIALKVWKNVPRNFAIAYFEL